MQPVIAVLQFHEEFSPLRAQPEKLKIIGDTADNPNPLSPPPTKHAATAANEDHHDQG